MMTSRTKSTKAEARVLPRGTMHVIRGSKLWMLATEFAIFFTRSSLSLSLCQYLFRAIVPSRITEIVLSLS